MAALNALGAAFEVVFSGLALLLVLLGFLQCFFGYRLFMAILALIGFLLGGVGGILAGGAVAAAARDSQALILVPFTGLIGALIGAYLAQFMYQIGVFLVGFVPGFVLTGLVVGALGLRNFEMALTLSAVGGLLVGLVALAADRFFIVLGTAFWGACDMALGSALLQTPGAAYLVGVAGIMQVVSSHLFAIVVLALLGILVQYGLTARLDRSTAEQGSRIAPGGKAAPPGRGRARTAGGPGPSRGTRAPELKDLAFSREEVKGAWQAAVTPAVKAAEDLARSVAAKAAAHAASRPGTPNPGRPLRPIPTIKGTRLEREWDALAPAPPSVVSEEEWDRLGEVPVAVSEPATSGSEPRELSPEEEWDLIERSRVAEQGGVA